VGGRWKIGKPLAPWPEEPLDTRTLGALGFHILAPTNALSLLLGCSRCESRTCPSRITHGGELEPTWLADRQSFIAIHTPLLYLVHPGLPVLSRRVSFGLCEHQEATSSCAYPVRMMSAAPSPARARPERLPVNPRRNKVPAESRKRVVKACNGCNVRRAKCSGNQPCDRCRKAARECIYPETEQTITIKRNEYEALLRGQTNFERRQSASSSGNDHSNRSDQQSYDTSHSADRSGFSNSECPSIEPDTPREGRILEDPHGTVRYLGESSGATFLNHLREFMATVFPVAFDASHTATQPTDTRFIAALGRYQTHDSRPLLTNSADALPSPSRVEATRMLRELSHRTRDGPFTSVSGGLYYWGDINELLAQYDSYSTLQAVESKCMLALINAMFAIACQLNPDCAPQWETSGGQVFFARARGLIGNPLDVASLAEANVLTVLGFFLLNSNRRDASYMYISIAMHIYLVHGVHRGWSIDEDGKRKFWDAYNLDRWLSCIMGRPAIVSDEAIKLDAPRDTPGLPPADGLRAHIELSRVTHYIAANVYGVSKHTAEPRSTALCVHKTLHMLKQWELELPPALRYRSDILNQDRAVFDLQVAANHLKVLAVRSWLFDSVKNDTMSICLRGHREPDVLHQEEIALAIEAARQTININRQLQQHSNETHLVHTVIHHIFNAALALELHRILSPLDSAADREAISFVTNILSNQLGGNKPFATDCAGVLVDLACMVNKLRERADNTFVAHNGNHSQCGPSMWRN
jgi:hypothetical protein